jgi:L-threonylcarbamoyladenylate synthase
MQIICVAKTKIEEIVKRTVDVLSAGGLIIYPTETCYGVGVDATNPEAVKKLLVYKKRPEGKAISIAVDSKDMAEKYVELNETAKRIYKEFLPGPVTVISKRDRNFIAEGIAAEDNTLGVRIPAFKTALEIIKAFGKPITATSANSAGKKTPYKISDILENLTQKQRGLVDLIIDAGELENNPPSTVIDTTKEQMKVLRKGKVIFGKLVKKRIVRTPGEMQRQAEKYLLSCKDIIPGNTILIMFNAELGAGKTQFVKGLAQALGIIGNVNSPTFVLQKEYPFQKFGINGNLIHIDAWRMESIEELKKLELPGFFQKGTVIALEWAGMAESYLNTLKHIDLKKIFIEIEYLDLQKRLLKIYEQD